MLLRVAAQLLVDAQWAPCELVAVAGGGDHHHGVRTAGVTTAPQPATVSLGEMKPAKLRIIIPFLWVESFALASRGVTLRHGEIGIQG